MDLYGIVVQSGRHLARFPSPEPRTTAIDGLIDDFDLMYSAASETCLVYFVNFPGFSPGLLGLDLP